MNFLFKTISAPVAGFWPVGTSNRLLIVISWLLLFVACGDKEKLPPPKPPQPPTTTATFKNPLLASAPDPWVVQRGDYYYYMHTLGNRIQIWKTTKMSQLASALTYTVFNAPATGINSRDVWAPEMFFLDNKWYIYYTASDGKDENHRMFVLENSNADPTTLNWVDKGQLQTEPSDLWSIDGTILERAGQLYFIWSGRPGAKTGNLTQNLYISKMQNPYTLTGATVMISAPTYAWERFGFGVNEGPEILKNKDGKVFLIYSGSYCGDDNYSLGMLTLTGADPLSPASWTKTATPVFSNSSVTGAYATGHNGFFKSKDGSEDWIIYHANSSPNQGCGGNRNVRMQKFTWTATGEPNFGTPVEIGKEVAVPKGE